MSRPVRSLDDLAAKAAGLRDHLVEQAEALRREIGKAFVRAHLRGTGKGRVSPVRGYQRIEQGAQSVVSPTLPLFTPAERNQAIEQAELGIRDLPYEVFLALDDSGQVAWANHGDAKQVEVPVPVQAAIRDGRITTYTHNHPSGHNSFSSVDFRMGCVLRVREMRCTSAYYRHTLSLKSGEPFTPEVWAGIRETIKAAEATVFDKFQNAVWSHRMSAQDASRAHWHEVWSLVKKKTPSLVYKRTVWPDRKDQLAQRGEDATAA